MWVLSRKLPRAPVRIGLSDLLLLGWFFLYVLFSIQPQVIYEARGPIFSLAPEFIQPFLGYSGGLVDYTARFLAQLDAWGWPGALSRTLQALLIGLLADAYFRRLSRRADAPDAPMPVPFVRFVPVVLYILQCGRYDQSAAIGVTLIAVLLGVLAADCACLRPPARFALYALVTVAVYYAAAGPEGKLCLVLALAAFAILSAALAARRARGGPEAAGWAAASLAFPALVALVGEKHFLTGNVAAWGGWWQVSRSTTSLLSLGILLFLPLAALAWGPAERLAGWRRARRAAEAEEAPGGEDGEEPPPAAALRSPAGRLLRPLLAAGALVWAVSLVAMNVTVDVGGGSRARMDYLVANGRWEEVLELARGMRPEDWTILTAHDVDTALFQTGRLSDELFSCEQRIDFLLLPVAKPPVIAYRWRLADQYLRMGRPNGAEMALYEALPMGGNDPRLLKRLAVVYMVKGQLPAARIYLNLLKHDLVYRGWAREYLARMESDPQLAGDPEVQALRARMLRRDDLLEVSDIATGSDATRYFPDRMLANLAKQNPRNRMAVEYLMAVYLLLGRPDLLAQELRYLDYLGLRRIPRAWEEGLVLYMSETGKKVDLRGRTISAETLERHARFTEVFARCGYDARTAYPEVARECPGSYFAYLLRMKGRQ